MSGHLGRAPWVWAQAQPKDLGVKYLGLLGLGGAGSLRHVVLALRAADLCQPKDGHPMVKSKAKLQGETPPKLSGNRVDRFLGGTL